MLRTKSPSLQIGEAPRKNSQLAVSSLVNHQSAFTWYAGTANSRTEGLLRTCLSTHLAASSMCLARDDTDSLLRDACVISLSKGAERA